MTAITKCRICGSTDLKPIWNLGVHALTGLFPRPDDNVPKSGLELLRCAGACGLVQLRETYDLPTMYGMDYGYRSGLNAGMVAHLKDLITENLDLLAGRRGDLVVDIGANDGTSLGFYPDFVRRVGIDPTGVKFKQYYKPGVELISDFFSAARLRELVGGQKARIVTSFAMFYDLEDPQAFMREVASVLAPGGAWIMEQSYLPAMLAANAFDTICHEHLEYYSLRQIEWMAARCGLMVYDVHETSTNGGSFVVKLCLQGSRRAEASVAEMRAKELTLGLQEPYTYEAFRLRSDYARVAFEQFLFDVRDTHGLKVCGLGASTKGNVLLQQLANGRAHTLIHSIGDVNPTKWGCVTPETWIPILSEDEVLAMNPDFLVVLPWHFKEGFLKNPKFKGRRLVFPLPQLEIIIP